MNSNPKNHKIFSSFLWAGFECTYAKAESFKRFDLLKASRHDEFCRFDYQLIRERGMQTVREGLAWYQIDKGNAEYDFSRFEPMMRIAKEEGIQQIWDLSHFDYPDHLDPFSDFFVSSYGEYAKRALETIRKYQAGTIFIVPVCEPSFHAWMCDNGLWAPYQKGKGTELKKQWVRAAINAMDAIWSIDFDVQFIHADPYMYRQPLRVRNKREQDFCDDFNNNVKYHSWDMICGKANPELGGNPKYLNFIGINYYFYNQQMVGINADGTFTFKSLSIDHKKRLPLHVIIRKLVDRYKTNIVISETGSYRERRPVWWNYILTEITEVTSRRLPLYGVCAYPILDIRKGAGFIVPKSGLWDFDQDTLTYERMPHEPTFKVLEEYFSKSRPA